MAETVVLGEGGRVVLPVAIRKRFGLEPGERLTVYGKDGEIRILSRKMALESLRADIVRQRGSLAGMLGELLADRRKEAAGE